MLDNEKTPEEYANTQENDVQILKDKYYVHRIVKTEVYLDKIWQLVKDNCQGFDIFEYDLEPSEEEMRLKEIQLRLKGEL